MSSDLLRELISIFHLSSNSLYVLNTVFFHKNILCKNTEVRVAKKIKGIVRTYSASDETFDKHSAIFFVRKF